MVEKVNGKMVKLDSIWIQELFTYPRKDGDSNERHFWKNDQDGKSYRSMKN